MIRRSFAFVTGAVLGGALLLPAGLVAQDGTKKPEGCGGCCGEEAKQAQGEKAPPASFPVNTPGEGQAQGKTDDAQQKMMEAFMALGKPGAEHRKLDPLVGTWTAKFQVWHDPAGQPMEGNGTCVTSWALGGRFLEQRSFSTMPCGTEMEGIGYTGFDNATGKYVGLWLDSMSTGTLVSTGEADAAGKVFTFRGEMKGPEGVTMKYRHQVEIVSTDKHVFRLWQQIGDAPETKMMEAVYTRR
jgi:hypothetical protein